jgi:hypothetical protein
MSGDNLSSPPAVNVKATEIRAWLVWTGSRRGPMPFCSAGRSRRAVAESRTGERARTRKRRKGRKPAIAPPSQRPGAILASAPIAVASTFRRESVDPCALGHARRDLSWPSARHFFAERVSPVAAEEGLWIVGSVS